MWIFIWHSISTKAYDQKKRSSSDATSALLLSVLSVTAESKCHPAQLRGLVSSGTETLGHLVSLCLQDLKQKWWSSQSQNKPLMISLYNYKLTFSLSHQLFWWSALVCRLLEKKNLLWNYPLKQTREVRSNLISAQHLLFWHLLHNCRKEDFSNSHINKQEKEDTPITDWIKVYLDCTVLCYSHSALGLQHLIR